MPDATRLGKPQLLVAAGIFVLALGLRLGYLVQVRASPTFDSPVMDAAYHDSWARRIAAGDWVGHEVFFRAPLYPYFLGLVYTLFGPNYVLVRVIQFLLGSVTCVLLYVLGLRVGGLAVGVLAGVMAALYGPLVYFDGELLLPVLETFFATALLLCLAWALDQATEAKAGVAGDASCRAPDGEPHCHGAGANRDAPRCGLLVSRDHLASWLLVGLCIGLFALTRPNILAFVPVLLVYLVVRLGWHAGARAGLVTALATLLCLLPVTVRNYLVGHDLVLVSSQAGVNFYIGNNPGADGVTAVVPGTRPTWWGGYRDAVNIAEKRAGRRLRPSEVSAFWFRLAMRYIRAVPVGWAQLLLRKTILFWTAFEVPNNAQIYPVSRFSPLLGRLVWQTPRFCFPFGLVAPLAFAGMALVAIRRNARLTPAVLFVIVYSASVIAFFVCARFRMPCIPALLLLAAYAVVEVVGLLRGRRWLAAGGLLWAALMVAALVNLDFYGTWRVDPAAAHLEAATAYQQKGALQEAEREYRLALRHEPYRVENKLGLALCLLSQERPNEAVPLLEDVLKVERHRWEAFVGMGDALAQQGRFEEALQFYKRATWVDPQGTEAFLRAGDVLRKLGRDNEAGRVYLKGCRGAPGDEALRLAIAQLYFDHGNMDKVIQLCVQLIREGFYFVKARVLLSAAYLNQQRFDEARPLAEEVLEREPGNTDALVVLAGCMLHEGKVDPAVSMLRRATELAPSSAQAWTNLGMALAMKGDLAGALTAADRALSLAPQDPEARFVRAGCYYEAKEYQKAVDECSRLLAEGPYFAPARELLDRCRDALARSGKQ